MRKLLLSFALLCFVPSLAHSAGCDEYAVFLSHFDGTDEATSATEENCTGSGAKTITFVGTAQLDTAQYKFGTASLLLDGNSDYVYAADSTDWDMAGDDTTIDAWVRFAATPTSGQVQYLVSQGAAAYWRFFFYNNGGQQQLYMQDADTGVVVSANITIATDTWYHFAYVHSGGSSLKLYQNGSQVGTATDATTFSAKTGTLQIGCFNASSGFFNGWIDEFRFSKGSARWTSEFTPPTEAYSAVTGRTRRLIIVKRFIKRKDGQGYDRQVYTQNFGWKGLEI